MKHIFIINPEAGPASAIGEIRTKLEKLNAGNYEIYITKAPLDATAYVRAKCLEQPGEKLRFYACGGDGTLNEVASGAVGFANAEVSCYPCGSGNDYVKYYGGKDAFTDLDALMSAEAQPVDIMKVCGRYCINVCNFGFDAIVAQTMIDVKRKKIIGGKNAYKTGVAKAIFKGRKNQAKIIADGKVLNADGRLLLCTVSNGSYVGGSFNCAPRSDNSDGLLEVCAVTPMSLFRFLKLIGIYTVGDHLETPEFKPYIRYCRAKKVEIQTAEGFGVCIDGEMTKSGNFDIEIVPGAIMFAAPVKVPAKV